MSPTLTLVLFVVGGFIAGSVPFGWIFARMKGIDLKQVGSGNIGATNAARALGRPIGALVLLLDAGKAYLPVWLAQRTVEHLPGRDPTGAGVALVGVAAILGHVFSPWLGGRGGKGVASSLGVFLALSPVAAGVAGAAWLVIFSIVRFASLASLLASVVLVLVMLMTHQPIGYVVAVLATFVLVVVRHVDNIKRLLARKETKL